MSSLSNIIKTQKYYPSFQEDDDFDEDMEEQMQNPYAMYRKKKGYNYKSMLINVLIALFIIFLFSRTFYNKIDELAVNSGISFFTKDGEPNILMIALQFIILIILLKIVCKY